MRCSSAGVVDGTEDRSRGYAEGAQLCLNSGSDAVRNWNCSDLATLSDQVSKHPVFLSPLKFLDSDGCEFGTAKSTAE
jgi:hypothetical protein